MNNHFKNLHKFKIFIYGGIIYDLLEKFNRFGFYVNGYKLSRFERYILRQNPGFERITDSRSISPDGFERSPDLSSS